MFHDSEVFPFIIVIFLTCPGQPHIHAVVLKAPKQKPFQVYFDLLLWIFQRYHAEPVITTVKCRFKPFDDENEPPKENIKLMGERERERKVIPSAKAALLYSEPSSCSLGSEIHPAQNDRNTHSVYNWQQMLDYGFRSIKLNRFSEQPLSTNHNKDIEVAS